MDRLLVLLACATRDHVVHRGEAHDLATRDPPGLLHDPRKGAVLPVRLDLDLPHHVVREIQTLLPLVRSCHQALPLDALPSVWGPDEHFSSVNDETSQLAPSGGLLPEEREGARVAVQEGRAADWADLAVAEEAAERDLAQLLAEEVRVVVGPAKEMRTPAQAGKEERSGGSHTHRRAVALEQPGQVLGRGAGVTQEELRDLQLLEMRADRDGAARLVDADQVAHQQLALAVLDFVLLHLQAEEEGVPEELAVARW